jgi:citrate synthase
MPRKPEWLDATEATRLLGVSRATLYAYVSRGYVRSEPVPGTPRARRYAREDVERLRVRGEERRDPEKAAAHALRWGVPILESGITLIANGKLYYRGHDAAELARTRSVEEVAALIWTGSFDTDLFDTPLHVVGGESAEDIPILNRMQSVLPLVAARDPLAFDLRPRGVAQTGWRIVNLLTSIAAESRELEPTVEETLARALVKEGSPNAKRAPELIRTALILCADHELNVSAFTARCVASADSNPYAVVLAGLAALEGAKHGGATERVEDLFDELRRSRDPKKALADRLRRGTGIDGFGHKLYPDGDPRAALLLSQLPKSKELALAQKVAEAAESVVGEKPNLDFSLVALARSLNLPRGAALGLFAIGRTIGWVAHAIEQYAQATMIRPRAKYVGPKV